MQCNTDDNIIIDNQSFFGFLRTIFNYLQIKKKKEIDDSEVTDSETRTDTIDDQDRQDRRPKTKEQEAPGELDPIPTLDTFPSLKVSATLVSKNKDSSIIILYRMILTNRTKIKYKLLFSFLLFSSRFHQKSNV